MFKLEPKALVEVPLPIATKPLIKSVVFDAKVILSIIQTDCYRVSEEGYVFGLVIGDCLEITNSIALPPEKVTTEPESDAQREANSRVFLEERGKFQGTVAKSLRDVNMDSEVAGWYCVSWPEPPTTKSVVETQVSWQTATPHFVMVSYDPWRSMSGQLHLRVLRLTPQYLAYQSGGDFSQKGVNDARLTGVPVYEEIPYSVHVPLLAQVFLYETQFSQTGLPRDGNSVMSEREHSGYLKRCMGEITTSLDTLARDLGECTGKTARKRKDADKADAQARHSSLLLSRGLPAECAHVGEHAVELVQAAAFASMMHQPK